MVKFQFPSQRQSSAYDYDSNNNSLVMVGGEVCTGTIWCNEYSNKTLITNDGGESFEELAPFPALLKGHCAVFLDSNTLMVIGGYKLSPGTTFDNTYFLDLGGNSQEKNCLENCLENLLENCLEIRYTRKMGENE